MEYFWYEREPELYEVEYNTMKKQFPQFEIYQMHISLEPDYHILLR